VLYTEICIAGRVRLPENQWTNVDFLDRALCGSITPFVHYSPISILKKSYYFRYKVHI
jgi:hypothetical protein